jgi:dTDP-D-glucose 4,6-dehydratase/ferredoxin
METKMLNIKINGQPYTVPYGTTVLEAAKLAGIDIPTLCYLKDINEIGACRLCLVEVKGARGLVTACVYPIEREGTEIVTNSPAITKARKMNLQLLLSNHNKKCLSCVRSTNCELQNLCREYGVGKFVLASTSSLYGAHNPMPYREDADTNRPLSPYAVSKVAQDYLGYQYFQSYGIKSVRTRGFNHTGPRRGQDFVTSNFCSQVAAIELGMQEPVIRVGNIDAIRDFTDVRDMVRAYWLAVTKAKPGEVYNIATGHGISIRDMLNLVLSNSKVEVRIEGDPERLRPSDVEILIGDSSKFRADTGWEPRIPFEQTVRDLLDYWRQKLAHRKRAV